MITAFIAAIFNAIRSNEVRRVINDDELVDGPKCKRIFPEFRDAYYKPVTMDEIADAILAGNKVLITSPVFRVAVRFNDYVSKGPKYNGWTYSDHDVDPNLPSLGNDGLHLISNRMADVGFSVGLISVPTRENIMKALWTLRDLEFESKEG
jgi:hypothetical protein